MADLMARDRPQDLWHQIEQLHLSYLQTEEVPEKLDHRKKLEGVIEEFISLVPHNRKFRFRETSNVLHRSATNKENFTGYGAATAWDSLALYASNLLSQPWRKEYRELELYCGFYKHEIDANLVGAETMLEEMGYKRTGQMTMVMDWPLDPDRVSYVSRDSLVAFVECQLMKKIWEEVSIHFQCGWLDILEFRENHVGSWDQVVQGLTYRYHQRQYQQNHQQLAAYQQDIYASGRHQEPVSTGYMYSQPPHINYCNYSPITPYNCHGYTLPLQAPIIIAQQPVPYVPPSYHLAQSIMKSQELYPNPVHYSSTMQNGYSTQGVYNYNNSSVPTGQLIELDAAAPPTSSDEQATDSSLSLRQFQPKRNPSVPKQRVQPREKSKDNGTGTFDSWDYVYKNLESQGYNKDLGERPDILAHKTISEVARGNQKKTCDKELEDALMEMRLEEYHRKALSSPTEPRVMKFNEALHKIHLESEEMPLPIRKDPYKSGVELIDKSESIYDNMSSPPKEKPLRIVPSLSNSMNRSNKATTKTLPREPSRYKTVDTTKYPSATLDSRRILDRNKKEVDYPNVNEISSSWPDDPHENNQYEVRTNKKWECVTCTYLNAQSLDVCEMCGKSKNRGPERPLASGGRECPLCTLVNEKDIEKCAACSCSLQGSSTYI